MKDLVARLKKANEDYRNGKPSMSDEVFDALEDQLRAKDPDHPWFDKTGAPVDGQWPEVQHSIPMRSLLKAQSEGDLKKWWPAPEPCVVTDKLDGISCRLIYSRGKLTQAITRGDGEVGSDITRNVKLMKGVPHHIKVDEAFTYVRSEIVCRKSDFAKHFPDESNPRNTAGGTAKRQSDPEKCRHLTVVSYQCLPDGVAYSTKRLELILLEKLGFTVTPYTLVNTPEEAISLREKFIDSLREERDWDIDGLVIEIDDRDARENLGEKNHRPAGCIAFKFPHEQKATVLRGIVWQVGRSGRVTPVAMFDMVVLAGAEIKRASLHNLDCMAELLQEVGQQVFATGDKILVARRNDVIPRVEAVIEGTGDENAEVFEPPTICPKCSYPLQRDGAYLVCPNTLGCTAQVSGAIKRWVDKLGIKFFGETLIDTLCDQGHLRGIADLYRLDEAQVASLEMNGRKVGSSSERGFKSLKANMDISLHNFVGSLGIPLIGRSMAQTIVDGGYDTLDKLLAAAVSDLAAIPMVGEAKAKSFVSGLAQLQEREVLDSILSVGITIQAPATGVMKGVSVCMSGFRDADMVKEIETQGGKIKSSVGKTLDFLVSKDPNSTTGKAKKAKQYGVAVIGIEEMWDKLGGRP